ncbi:FAD/NAD(P)-binding protein [Vibrio cholerae]
MKTNIVIVGGGASCISFIYAFIKNKKHVKGEVTITIVEKLKEFGPGNAYMDDLDSNILNTKAEFISVLDDKPGDFFQWTVLNKDKWLEKYPFLEINKSTYVPRALFGLYMADTFEKVCEAASDEGVNINKINDEVFDVSNDAYGYVKVFLKSGKVLVANKLILACGTQHLSNNRSGIINNPYPTLGLKNRVAVNDKVAIIGSRLSAIDTIIALMESGHNGKITIFSRSGNFPYVRGSQGRYKNHFLNKDYIERNFQSMTLEDIVELYNLEECRYYDLNPECKFEPFPLFSFNNFDLRSFINSEIEKSSEPRAWQAILYDTNSCIDYIWNKLIEDDKKRFFHSFYSKAMSLRVSIPENNAKKILSYLESGKLEFISGDPEIKNFKNSYYIHSKRFKGRFDKVIYAVGSPRSVKDMDSDLLNNMLINGDVKEHLYGGIVVDSSTYGVVNDNDEISTAVYAIGEITSGQFIFTSAMDIIIRHASSCAKNLDLSHSESIDLEIIEAIV